MKKNNTQLQALTWSSDCLISLGPNTTLSSTIQSSYHQNIPYVISEHLTYSAFAISLSALPKNPSGLLHRASEVRRPIIELNDKSPATVAACRHTGALLSDPMHPSDHLVGIGSIADCPEC